MTLKGPAARDSFHITDKAGHECSTKNISIFLKHDTLSSIEIDAAIERELKIFAAEIEPNNIFQ